MDMNQAPGVASSSSDFVRKLYKMLEDPSYAQVVRWSDDGTSFVVLENERFTKSILPKHFKHSNFASFVRQLNKYDFHKVRHNNEENGQSPYGAGAWEFKHPDFKANNRDSLDNIRRKAPAPRKTAGPVDESLQSQQIDMLNGQLVATQQQLEQLQQRCQEMSMHQSMLVQELIGVQKTVLNHEHVMQNVMNFLHSVDAKHRRDSKVAGGPFAPTLVGQANGATSAAAAAAAAAAATSHPPALTSLDQDEPASPLQNASRLLNDLNADEQINFKTLEHMNHDIALRGNGFMTTPPPDSTSRSQPRAAASADSSSTMAYARLSSNGLDPDTAVYPVGTTQGIDPMYSEHINNIPYSIPPKEAEAAEPRSMTSGRKRSTGVDPGWTRPPQILLVEDDATCRRIGSKFLYSFNCAIDSALDGMEAVDKMNKGSKYDLVLMDIIMPNLDGVSACHLIRQFDHTPHTPIIAMTSNIRSDDISMYFSHGMNDVLPKPFTKEGLLNMLEKHLPHLKQIPPPAPHEALSVKEDATPSTASPSTISTWHSPGRLDYTISPVTTAAGNPAAGVPGGVSTDASPVPVGMAAFASQQPPPSAASRPANPSQSSQHQHSHDAKRQRLYEHSGPPGGAGAGAGAGGGMGGAEMMGYAHPGHPHHPHAVRGGGR